MESQTTVPTTKRKKITFAYDYMGRRVMKSVHGWNTSQNNYGPESYGRTYVYDGWNVVAELQHTLCIRTMTWGKDLSGSLQGAGGISGLVFVHEWNLPYISTAYPVYDGNGNITAMVSASDGTVAASYEYSPYGEVLTSNGTYTRENPFRFSTKYTDTETGLSYFGYRYYNPETGRWLNRDPIAEWGGVNLYAFNENDPLFWVDPYGLYTWEQLKSDVDYYVDLGVQTSKGFIEGSVQGFSNVANRGQDFAIDFFNIVNNLSDTPRSPYEVSQTWVDSPDWSEDLVYKEDPLERRISNAAAWTFWATIPISRMKCPVKVEGSINTPFGVAYQSGNFEAKVALYQARGGVPVYRQGGLGIQNTADAQFWSLQNPAKISDFSNKMGMPAMGDGPFWIMSGRVKVPSSIITREAPGIGINTGHGIEVVTEPYNILIDWFYMP